MDAVSTDLEGGQNGRFVIKPFFPAMADRVFIHIRFGEPDKEMVMAGFAFHEPAVESPEVLVVEAFAEAFKAFAAAGFDEGEDQEAIEEAFVFIGVFFFKFHQFVDVCIFALAAELEAAFLEFGQDEAEMAPFFGDDGGEFGDKDGFFGVALDERDAAGSGFLFAPGMVGKDKFQGEAGEVYPARVGGELEAEDVLLAGGGFHGTKLRRFGGNF